MEAPAASGRACGVFLASQLTRQVFAARFVTYSVTGDVITNRAEQYRIRAQWCLEIARSLSPPETKHLMDRATLIDMAQTWLRLAQEQEQQVVRAERSEPVRPTATANPAEGR